MDLSWLKALTRRRPINTTGSGNNQLQRRLGAWDLIFYGVGCSVGAGIYSLVGVGAHTAGPSISVSFLLAGVACCFTSLAYAEFASLLQTAGSAYTYAYVAFGELAGWLVGWNLTLGYAISAAVVARSWAEYVVGLLNLGPDSQWRYLTKLPLGDIPMGGDHLTCCPLSMIIIAICTGILVTGTKESTRFNTIMTILNLTVLAFIVLVGSPVVDTDNWQPFFPNGVTGMAEGAGLVFFSYLGFDMVSCLSEEVENPDVNMPIGIIGSLGVSITIYVTVAAVVVGMAPIPLLGDDIPIVNALLANACCTHQEQIYADSTTMECLSYACDSASGQNSFFFLASRVVSFGAVFGLTTATFTCLMGQPRIFYSIAKDGLFFQIYARVNPKTGIPTLGTIVTGALTAVIACLFDLESLANVISLGTLQVFTFVNAGVILLRLRPGLVLGNNEGVTQEQLESNSSRRLPLAQSPRSDAIARSLGLVNQTSLDVRQSLRSSARASSLRDLSANTTDSQDATIPTLYVLGFTLSSLFLSMAIAHQVHLIFGGVMVLAMVLCTIGLYSLLPPEAPTQTTQSSPTTFQCPMVPAVPLCGILCNCYMMGSMQSDSWILIGIWLLIGLTFYFSYGIHHSILNHPQHPKITATGEKQSLLARAKAETSYGGRS